MHFLKVTTLVGFCAWLCGTAAASDGDKSDILNQQKELERIRNEVKLGQAKLDSLQSEGKRVTRKLSEYDEKISSDRRVISRLNSELGQLKSSIKATSDQLQERESTLDRMQRRYLGNVRQFYLKSSGSSGFLSFSPNSELVHRRKVVYLTALAGFESENVAQAEVLLEEASSQLEDLSGRSKVVSGLKRKRETSVAIEKSQRSKQQKTLDLLQRRSREESDRILTLKEAAQEMEAIIARLERERQRAIQAGGEVSGSSLFASLKGRLPSPFRGKVVAKYGNSVDPVTRLKSFSPGITIKGSPGGMVRSVALGTVAYSGELRGYGKFVIINHDNQFYTTYAGLGKVLVSQGQYIQAQTAVGEASSDGTVKLEIRRGRESLDPVEWIS
ncbi:MAG: murein hydrolase activator EnvC family protein, partial [Planctomycetota bacterium]